MAGPGSSRNSEAARPLAEPPRPRPLLVPLLAVMAGMVCSATSGVAGRRVWLVAAAVPLVAGGLLCLPARRLLCDPRLRSGLLIAAGLGFGYARHQSAARLAPDHLARWLGDRPVLTRLAGQVVSTPTSGPAEKRNPFLAFDPPPRTGFLLAARELRTSDPPLPVSGRVRVSVEAAELGARLGDAVVVTGRLYKPRGPRNPGEPDWARWNRLQGVRAAMSVAGAQYVSRVPGAGSRPRHLLAALRTAARGLLLGAVRPGQAEERKRLLETMVLGRRSAAGRRLNEAFLRTGGLHFLAVSGFHVGVLAGAVWLFARKVLRRSTRTGALVVLIVLLLYAAIAEFNAPILRATTMGVLGCLALALPRQRPLCPLNWLCLSALVLLAHNPQELFRAGFQLSFVQVAMLLIVFPQVYRRLARRGGADAPGQEISAWPSLLLVKLARWAAGLALLCACAWVTALPLVLYHFGRFAPWGWAQSVLIAPLVGVTVVLGFLTIVGGWIPLLGAAIGRLAAAAAGWLLAWVGLLAEQRWTLLEWPRPPLWLVLASYATAAALIGWRWPARRLLRVRLTLVALAGLGASWAGWRVLLPGGTGPGYAVHVLDVGSGSATLLTAPNRHAVLIDAGTIANFDAGRTVAGALPALGVRRLEAVAITHANFDHYSGVPTLLARLAVGQMWVNPYFEQQLAGPGPLRALRDALPQNGPPRLSLHAGNRRALDQAWLEVLWPPDSLDRAWRRNDRSLVMRLVAHGRRVLLPGDIQRRAIRALLAAHAAGRIDLRCDALLAPHHGSVVPGDTAALLSAAAPRVIVVSSARQRPELEELVRRTLGGDCRLISTRDVGAVSLRIMPDGALVVRTPYAAR